MSDLLVIENVDTEMLDKQRLRLVEALLNPDVCKAMGKKCEDALQGLLNMLDDWSDKRAEFFEPPVEWQPVETILELIQHKDWSWTRNRRCKYIALFLDTRDRRCLLRDRNHLRISLEDLQKQYVGEEE